MSPLTRRRFLSTLGFGAGAAALMPTFRALADPITPRRFVIVLEANGVEPAAIMSDAARAAIVAQASADGERYFAHRYGHSTPLEIPADFATSRALAPLVGDGVNLDLSDRSAALLGLSSRVTGGGHVTYTGALSCARAFSGRAPGQTIDAWLAERPEVRGLTPFDAVRLGVNSTTDNITNGVCAYAAGRSASLVVDPSVAYGNLFGAVASAADQLAFQRRGRLLDFAHADVASALTRFSGNSRERAKLEQYLASIEEVTLRRDRLEAMSTELAAVRPDGPALNPQYTSEDHLEQLRAQFALATAALLGELTHVVVLSSGGGGGFDLNYPSIIPDVRRHDLHHGSEGNQPWIDAIHDISRAHVDMVATMARTLAATPEPTGDGNMLDHTAILYMTENGERHHSRAEEWPALLVGGESLGLRTGGRTVVFPGFENGNNRQVSNLFNTLGYAAGGTLDDFGLEGTGRIAEGPLSELQS